ncbi:ABC transporter ATP-binding protein [Coraliomargarita akajimensis]|uniref:ABC transporter related protein n=1 Tax=Coraliomargarita akajimensis (strain DSM 45221 / IAM 15411 / JCM 23193 / KCTC 12865 / 04OKA010-24) TaxID=583355 RepID=D5EKX2_CORAD|nr:ABC transporter ATP-binding protein [Coraliomargarita akajimensis]ADE53074.1 ABC transporter related protein [Coraliomargarita akajimensis DSM 45221]
MTQSQTQSLIRCRGLSKTYRKGATTVTPLEALDLDVGRGEFLALMGPSGSGKTTLLNLIAGIDHPTTGELWVGERNLAQLSRGELTSWRAQHCGYIFQLYHLVPILTAFENVELPLLLNPNLSRNERRTKVRSALELVGLADRMDHRPSELSGGQEQRVAIARAIVTDPQLLVADEPTGDLDRESATSILQLMNELSADFGKTIVMVTHDAIAAAAASRTLHLEKGQLVEQNRIHTSTTDQ